MCDTTLVAQLRFVPKFGIQKGTNSLREEHKSANFVFSLYNNFIHTSSPLRSIFWQILRSKFKRRFSWLFWLHFLYPYPVRLQDCVESILQRKKSVPMHLKEKTLSYSIKKLLQQHQKRKQRHFFEIRHLSRQNGTKKWCTNLVTLWSWNRISLACKQLPAPLLILWWLTRLCLLCGPIPAFFLVHFSPSLPLVFLSYGSFETLHFPHQNSAEHFFTI